LSKAASTYLQKRVFPELKGIQYIHRNRYWKFQQIIEQSPGGRFLVSREAAEFPRLFDHDGAVGLFTDSTKVSVSSGRRDLRSITSASTPFSANLFPASSAMWAMRE
jgi:hypothetical protein